MRNSSLKNIEPPRHDFNGSRQAPTHVSSTGNGSGLSLSVSKTDTGPGSRRTAVLPAHVVSQALDAPVLRGLLPLAVNVSLNVTGCQQDAPARPGEGVLLYCTNGRGWFERSGQKNEICAGQLVVFRPGEARVYGADSAHAWSFAWVHATGVNLDFFLRQIDTEKQTLLKVGDDSRFLGWFIELLSGIQPGCGSAELLNASQTLAHLFSALICSQREEGPRDNDTACKIEQSIAYMKQHLDEPLRAAALAAVARMSLPHYFVLFKKRTGCTPIDYFIHLRMQHARQLLTVTPWSVKEVAAALGYEDPLYFSRVFKAVNHVAPSQFRLEHNEARILGENGNGQPGLMDDSNGHVHSARVCSTRTGGTMTTTRPERLSSDKSRSYDSPCER